jgi:hypothetical protein
VFDEDERHRTMTSGPKSWLGISSADALSGLSSQSIVSSIEDTIEWVDKPH